MARSLKTPGNDRRNPKRRTAVVSPMKTKTKPLSEYHIAKTCSDWLALDNWRRLNTNPVSDTATIQAIRGSIAKCCGSGGIPPWLQDCLRGRGKGFGELGMADDLYIRYELTIVSGSGSLLRQKCSGSNGSAQAKQRSLTRKPGMPRSARVVPSFGSRRTLGLPRRTEIQ